MSEFADVIKSGVTRVLNPEAVVLMDPATGNLLGTVAAPFYVSGTGQVSTVTANIAAAGTVSGAIDLGLGRLARISTPSAWTAADITLLVSFNNVIFNTLSDKDGVEYTIKAGAAREILIPLGDMLGIRYIKLRSGTSALPVAQASSRDLILTLAT